MLGTIVNVIAIVIGSFIGILLKKGIKEEFKDTIMNGIGLTVIIIGINSAIKSDNMVIVIISIVLGIFIGENIRIEDRLNKLGNKMEKKFSKGDSNFSKGFVTASLVFCIGAMAIVGALESGLNANHQTLFAKSIIDGITSIIFASTLGIGVAFSAIPIFFYRGGISLLAQLVKNIFTPSLILEMSAVGGILITAIGINILGIKNIKVGNMLPGIFIPILYYVIINLL